MPLPGRGEVWLVDLGMAAKVRPCLLLTEYPADDELALITVVPHTTSLRGNRWEIAVPKPFLKPGAFHVQQVQSIPVAKFTRKLGGLTSEELSRIVSALTERFGSM